jgi:hypothetical protein
MDPETYPPIRLRENRDHRPQVLAKLGDQFAEFRRTHKSQTRIPENLRAAIAAAVRAGVAVSALQAACRISWSQVNRWCTEERVQRRIAKKPTGDVQVLSVVDRNAGDVRTQVSPPPPKPTADLELRFGPWRVRIDRDVASEARG